MLTDLVVVLDRELRRIDRAFDRACARRDHKAATVAGEALRALSVHETTTAPISLNGALLKLRQSITMARGSDDDRACRASLELSKITAALARGALDSADVAALRRHVAVLARIDADAAHPAVQALAWVQRPHSLGRLVGR